MVFWDNVQRLLDEAFHGKIKISSVRNTANGAEAAAGDWIIMLERCSSFDLVPVWRLMMRRQGETGKPVLAVLLDEEHPSTAGPLHLEGEDGPFPGLLIYRFGTDSPQVLEQARRIAQLYRIH